MKSKKVIIWILVIGLCFAVGWFVSKVFPFKEVEHIEISESSADSVSWRGFMRISEQLDLEEGQKEIFFERERAYRDSLYYYRQQLDSLESYIIRELAAEDPDREQLNKLASEIGSSQERIKKITIAHFLVLRDLCNEQQQEKLSSMFYKMRQGYKYGQGKGMGMKRGRRNR